MKAIEVRDNEKIQVYVNNLIQSLIRNNSVSKIYVDHIFYDIIHKLYVKFGVYDKALIYTQTEKLFKCRDAKELQAVFKEMLEEITKSSTLE